MRGGVKTSLLLKVNETFKGGGADLETSGCALCGSFNRNFNTVIIWSRLGGYSKHPAGKEKAMHVFFICFKELSNDPNLRCVYATALTNFRPHFAICEQGRQATCFFLLPRIKVPLLPNSHALFFAENNNNDKWTTTFLAFEEVSVCLEMN